MIRHFCNRCGEVISDNKYATGANVKLPGPKGKEHMVWEVEVRIRHADSDWKLCLYCCDEIIDEAYKSICEMRAPVT